MVRDKSLQKPLVILTDNVLATWCVFRSMFQLKLTYMSFGITAKEHHNDRAFERISSSEVVPVTFSAPTCPYTCVCRGFGRLYVPIQSMYGHLNPCSASYFLFDIIFVLSHISCFWPCPGIEICLTFPFEFTKTQVRPHP